MVKRNYPGVIVIALSTALTIAALVRAGEAPPPSIQVEQKKLIIRQGEVGFEIDLAKTFHGYEINEGKLLFASADAKARYLVTYVAGPSRSPVAALSFCGAGTEGYLLWSMFDQAWREQRRQAALIESCFESAEGIYEINGDRLTAEWVNYRLEKRFTLKYDARAPAQGFRIGESKIVSGK